MANSTTNVDTVIASQASKEVTINAAFDAASQSMTYGRRASTSSGLTWGYYGGNVVKTDGSMVQIANGTLTLTASQTCYIVALKSTGAVSFSTASTNWLNQTDYWRLYSVVTGASTVTSYTDSRDFWQRPATGGGGMATVALGGTGQDFSAVAKGGLISGTGSGTFGVTAVGTDGKVLSADAASTGGVKWVDIPGGGDMLLGTAQTVTANKSFNDGTFILKGSSSGTTTVKAQATAGSGTVNMPLDGDVLAAPAGGKTTPIDADYTAIVDTAASNTMKRLTWANIKATLKTYFDGLYQAASATLNTWAGITPGANVGTFLATPSSANLASAVTDETGSGALVFATSPTLVTPVLGTPTSGTLTNCTGLPVAGGGTGQTTAQAAINALSNVSAATNEYVLTKDTATGNAIFKAAAGGGGAGDFKADGTVPMTGNLQMGANGVVFEGSTADAYETTLNVINPTANRAVNLPDASGTVALTSGLFSGLRNKIVNGCGWIDQANINAAVTVNSTANVFGPDKWSGFGQSTDGIFTLTGSKSVFYPAGKGMPSSIYVQTTTADASIGASQLYGVRHVIEGQFCAEWRMGTANAATVKLRFAVRSSLTGTHCVALKNNAADRSYVATFTISSADTWEEKEITVALDTTGTWLTTNGAGIKLIWNLGAGSNFETTANTWAAGNYSSVAGCVNVIGTLNATFAITDVDMRLASDNAVYEFRDVQRELDLCQREYCKTFPMTTAPAQNAGTEGAINGVNDGITANGYVELCWQYPVRMRAEPTTVTTYNPLAANSNWSTGDAATVGTNTNDRHAYVFSTNTTASNAPSIHIVADARL